jgi:dihydroflavonol-4-reductase
VKHGGTDNAAALPFAVYYFSGTGNSLDAARTIAAKTGGRTFPMTREAVLAAKNHGERAAVFVFPSYAYGLPGLVRRFLKKIPLAPDYLAAVVTCGSAYGGSLAHARRLLQARGRRLNFSGAVESQENFLPIFGVPEEERMAERLRLHAAQAEIVAGSIAAFSHNAPDRAPFLSAPISLVFRAASPLLACALVISRACTGCGLCESLCPAGAIVVRGDGRRKILRRRCQHCQGCLNFCPKKAVRFLRVGPETGRYHHPAVKAKDMIVRRLAAKPLQPPGDENAERDERDERDGFAGRVPPRPVNVAGSLPPKRIAAAGDVPAAAEPNTLYLVTGATGFVGGAVTDELLRRGYRVRAYVRRSARAARLQARGVEICYGDIRDHGALKAAAAFDGRLIVIHAAGVVALSGNREKRREMTDIHVRGTKNIIDLCQKHGDCRLVYISSVHAVPPQKKGTVTVEPAAFDENAVRGAYAKSKAVCTRLVLDAARRGLDALTLHPSGILGPGDPGETDVTRMLVAYSRRSIPASVRGGYDFVDCRDVARGVADAAIKGRAGEAYLLTGGYHSVAEFLHIVYGVMPVRRLRHSVPLWAAYAALPFMRGYAALRRRPPLFTRYYLDTLGQNGAFSHQKAADELGFTVRPFVETVTDTVKALRDANRLG